MHCNRSLDQSLLGKNTIKVDVRVFLFFFFLPLLSMTIAAMVSEAIAMTVSMTIAMPITIMTNVITVSMISLVVVTI